MKFFAALLTIAIAPLALAAPAAAGAFFLAAYSSGSCAISSILIQKIAGTDAYSGHCFLLAQPMASFDLIMTGGCSITAFYLDSACTKEYESDNGSPWIAGCQTFSPDSIISFKVTCYN